MVVGPYFSPPTVTVLPVMTLRAVIQTAPWGNSKTRARQGRQRLGQKLAKTDSGGGFRDGIALTPSPGGKFAGGIHTATHTIYDSRWSVHLTSVVLEIGYRPAIPLGWGLIGFSVRDAEFESRRWCVTSG